MPGYNLTSIVIFCAAVLAALLIDLFSHKKDKPVSMVNSALWSVFWVVLSFVFAFYIGWIHGMEKAYLFISGYLLEKSLSVDNLFVFMAIFSSFAIKDQFQHRILYFGIIGALIMRFLFIAVGTSLLLLGQWVLAVFGAFVLWSAWKMYQAKSAGHTEIQDYTNHWSVKLARKIFSVHPYVEGNVFFLRQGGKLFVTPLFLCVIAVEAADIMFAFDSVPAVIAITQEPFLIYTSNIFAILGLRSMYFLLAAAKKYLCHLEMSVIVILAFIGVKMLLAVTGLWHIPVNASLIFMLLCLTGGIIASIAFPKQTAI
ncbi:MAG: TerC/Alx family metal homeostasis membrane protein [Nitrospirae bacterium YQR-1]